MPTNLLVGKREAAPNPCCKLVLRGANMRSRGKQAVRGVHVCVYALRMTSRPSRVIAARRFCVREEASNGTEFGVSDDVRLKMTSWEGGGGMGQKERQNGLHREEVGRKNAGTKSGLLPPPVLPPFPPLPPRSVSLSPPLFLSSFSRGRSVLTLEPS